MKRFTTFEGVFTPCLLSILGVIMYLRLGWVVGSVGLGQALLIIALANFISLATTLSMSSIVTNIRIGAGGAYSIITKSLGLEVGGAIGIPLYLSQAISVAFYIIGFTECWHLIFPQHNFLFVSIMTWAVLFFISYASAKLAFRLQYGIMALIGISLVSIFFSQSQSYSNPVVWQRFNVNSFWSIFAIFFPAVTGFLAGATMSGELKEPKRSIPFGTLGAVFVGFFIYVILAIWLNRHASSGELIANKAILIDLGRWRWAILAGIMGATLSSALSMFVASPRTLLALGKHSIVPLSHSFSLINKKGEPQAAILFTSFLILLTLMLGTLDSVASLLTMFFLITYGVINISVFIEQSIGIVSFRPTFQISRFIPLTGSVACFLLMFFINVPFSLIAIMTILLVYWILLKREVKVYSPDVRSGLLVYGAEQLAKSATKLPYHPKIWKPNLLVPVEKIQDFPRLIDCLKAIVLPSGRIIVLSVIEENPLKRIRVIEDKRKMSNALSRAVQPLKEEGIFTTDIVVESPDFFTGATAAIQTLRGTFFPPNTLFLTLTNDKKKDHMVENIIRKAEDESLGIIVLLRDPQLDFREQKTVNLWIRRQSPNINLSILVALQLKKNWDGHARIIQVVDDPQEVREAESYLIKLRELMRIPVDTEIKIMVGRFKEVLKQTPEADINIFGMPREPDIPTIREVSGIIKTSVLFLRDSEHEKATA